ncbi:MAG: hypothetical protein K6E10_00315 [Eubacterium sp.]|nr:hypothetical protein [Eubacterium sp.]
MIFSLFGCGKQKYSLNYDENSFKCKKKNYAEGENVTLYYGLVATDTDYRFYTDSEDVKLDISYDDKHGYIIKFEMPAHDVNILEESHNSMEYDPDEFVLDSPENIYEEIETAEMAFDYYEAVIATEGGNDIEEYVIYYREEASGLILAKYTKLDGQEEEVLACIVPEELITYCLNMADYYDMDTWGSGDSSEGQRTVIKYVLDDKVIRVSSESMPENGPEAFSDFKNLILEYWNKYYIEEASPGDSGESGQEADDGDTLLSDD